MKSFTKIGILVIVLVLVAMFLVVLSVELVFYFAVEKPYFRELDKLQIDFDILHFKVDMCATAIAYIDTVLLIRERIFAADSLMTVNDYYLLRRKQ